MSSIVVNPADSRVLYVTTLDQPYHDNAMAEGLLKSRDGGRTWQHENAGLSHVNLKSVNLSAHDPSLIFLSSGGNGVFIGHDDQPGGKTAADAKRL